MTRLFGHNDTFGNYPRKCSLHIGLNLSPYSIFRKADVQLQHDDTQQRRLSISASECTQLLDGNTGCPDLTHSSFACEFLKQDGGLATRSTLLHLEI